MNAHAEIVPSAHQTELHWSKLWRSDCIDQFSSIELKLQELLSIFADAKRIGVRVKTHQPIRQAYDEIQRLLKGSFKEAGRPVLKTVAALETELDWRGHLTHGELREWICRSSKQRMLTLRLMDPGEKRVRIHAYPENEANERLSKLQKLVIDLNSQVGQIRKSLSS